MFLNNTVLFNSEITRKSIEARDKKNLERLISLFGVSDRAIKKNLHEALQQNPLNFKMPGITMPEYPRYPRIEISMPEMQMPLLVESVAMPDILVPWGNPQDGNN